MFELWMITTPCHSLSGDIAEPMLLRIRLRFSLRCPGAFQTGRSFSCMHQHLVACFLHTILMQGASSPQLQLHVAGQAAVKKLKWHMLAAPCQPLAGFPQVQSLSARGFRWCWYGPKALAAKTFLRWSCCIQRIWLLLVTGWIVRRSACQGLYKTWWTDTCPV